MRTTLDFTPLFQSSIGFRGMLNALEASRRDGAQLASLRHHHRQAMTTIASLWR
jgi:hypothetical protein